MIRLSPSFYTRNFTLCTATGRLNFAPLTLSARTTVWNWCPWIFKGPHINYRRASGFSQETRRRGRPALSVALCKSRDKPSPRASYTTTTAEAVAADPPPRYPLWLSYNQFSSRLSGVTPPRRARTIRFRSIHNI